MRFTIVQPVVTNRVVGAAVTIFIVVAKTALDNVSFTIVITVEVEVIDFVFAVGVDRIQACLLYTSPSPRDKRQSRMPSSA